MLNVIDENRYIKDELWTAKQRQSFPLHYTVSYRGSFKSELPEFFINELIPSKEIPLIFDSTDDITKRPIIFDPFSGRGTTALQANYMGYRAIANDINPMMSKILDPLTNPPTMEQIKERLIEINFNEERNDLDQEDFLPFYHKDTFRQILNLKDYLSKNRDFIDKFIEVIALSRLHGHSKGFFSAYSFPQISVNPNAQKKINSRHSEPEFRNLPELIARKAKSVLKDEPLRIQRLKKFHKLNKILSEDSRDLKSIKDESVDLIITSPPFLSQVDYIQDNWIENWFLGIDSNQFKNNLVITNSTQVWEDFIYKTMKECYRILRPGKHIAIEVGDVTQGRKKINLEELVIPQGMEASFKFEKLYINEQKFTKLSNCFKVDNNKKGVNTNRIVVFSK